MYSLPSRVPHTHACISKPWGAGLAHMQNLVFNPETSSCHRHLVEYTTSDLPNTYTHIIPSPPYSIIPGSTSQNQTPPFTQMMGAQPSRGIYIYILNDERTHHAELYTNKHWIKEKNTTTTDRKKSIYNNHHDKTTPSYSQPSNSTISTSPPPYTPMHA